MTYLREAPREFTVFKINYIKIVQRNDLYITLFNCFYSFARVFNSIMSRFSWARQREERRTLARVNGTVDESKTH